MLLLERVLASTDELGNVTASADDVLRARQLQGLATTTGRGSDVLDLVGMADSTTTLARNWPDLSPEERMYAVLQTGFYASLMGANAVTQRRMQQSNPYASKPLDDYMQQRAANNPRPGTTRPDATADEHTPAQCSSPCYFKELELL
jgi:hypothetical protein